jgi:hypothetical protein
VRLAASPICSLSRDTTTTTAVVTRSQLGALAPALPQFPHRGDTIGMTTRQRSMLPLTDCATVVHYSVL